MNFYPFHIGDYISHTSHLTDEEDLTYRRMIDLYYMTEAPFINDREWIARRVRSTPQIVYELLHEFFELGEDDLWHSPRADKEIAKYQYLSESGKKGAEKRWGNRDAKVTNSTPNSHPNATPIATKTKNQEPIYTPDGVSADLWKEFLDYRKRLRAPVTERIVTRLIKESKDADMTLSQVLEMIMFKGWRSFEAKWIPKDVQQVEKVKFI
jgi:uncharacterized protein YdaU (DUF1376 family)